MKKLLLILSLVCISFTAFAADLNPFAYGLKSSVNALNPMQLDIQFSINAPATSVEVVVYDIATKTDVYTQSCAVFGSKHDYTLSLDLSEIPGQYRGGVGNLGWRVDVKGAAVAQPTFAHNQVKLDFPSSIDIDNNPENENFGTVFVVEALPTGIGKSELISNVDGAGLYILNADGTARPMPNRPAGKYGYNGGRVNPNRQYFNGTSKSGFSPYRVRVSDDGRIFISSMTPDGEVLWEADPLVFSRPDAPDWETRAVAGWSHVISDLNANTVMGTQKRNCDVNHSYCGIYHLYQGDAGGPFIAGPNIGFDVRGSGKDLKLLMLAGCKDAIVNFTSNHFYCDEYDLGEAKMWNTPPSRRIFRGHVVNYCGAQVQYDGDGNVWLCQHREPADASTLMKFNAATENTVLYDEKPVQTYRRCAAIRFNNDFTQVAIASKGTGYGGAFTIYPVVDGMPVWSQGKEVDCKSVTHHSLMDFAWDYAGNLYITADEQSNSAGDCVAIYAMPRTADEVVSTPAASRYAFEVNCASDASYLIGVTAVANQGLATITAGFDAEGKVPACTPVEVFAQSKDGYKFVCWKDGSTTVSTDNPYTFSAVKDVTLTACFAEGAYKVTWHNLLDNKNDIDGSGDLDKLEELYNLIMVYFNDYNLKINGASSDGSYIRWAQEWENGKLGNIQTFFSAASGSFLGVARWVEGFLINNSDYKTFRWLGDYINTVKSNTTSNTGYYYWLTHFFAGYKEWYLYNSPSQWLPYYWESTCGLNKQMDFSTPMPVIIKEISPTKSEITNKELLTKTPYPSWYVRNYQANKLLAWRDGSVTGDVVHHVYRDNMKLYATYVDTRLQEEDPTPDLSKDPYDATNNDVLDLLANKNHGSTLLNFTIDRKFVGEMYNTVCFPFDIPISKLPDELKNADIRVFSSVSENNESGESEIVLNFITLQEYWVGKDNYLGEPYMEAGVPYLIMPNVDVNADYLTYSGLPYWYFFDSSKTPKTNTVGGVSFHGVLNPTELPKNAYILVANNRLAKVIDSGDKMNGFRGYFTWDDPVRMPPAILSISVGKEVTTDVEDITIPLLDQQPQTPQVRKIMYDGKIYILRGDEVYTITGHRVK